MDFSELKKLINSKKERIILVEDGKPAMVLLSFEEYSKIIGNSEQPQDSQVGIEASEDQKKPQRELRVEDLPF